MAIKKRTNNCERFEIGNIKKSIVRVFVAPCSSVSRLLNDAGPGETIVNSAEEDMPNVQPSSTFFGKSHVRTFASFKKAGDPWFMAYCRYLPPTLLYVRCRIMNIIIHEVTRTHPVFIIYQVS